MTRVVRGIYDDIELDTGFFISDNEIDLLCGWLSSYADALEKAWVRGGSIGAPMKQKHEKVRSFMRAVSKQRGVK